MNLDELGFDARRWRPEVEALLEKHEGGCVARVAADFGVELRVVGDFGDERARFSGRVRFGDGVRPAVGDFVWITGEVGSRTVVDLLSRKSWLARQAAGKKAEPQTIAANLDVVFVVTSFNEDFNFNRIERYLTAVHDGGARSVVVVNKADLVSPEEQDARLKELKDRIGETPVVSASALDGGSIAALRPHLENGQTSSFVGSSGVGKSTLVNQLLGEERQTTADVREADAKGRHTTTHREMFFLPGGAIVIDTPGMREFQLWDEGSGLDSFADIESLADTCRFRDCAHGAEPGCAVREAVEQGGLTTERLQSWRKLSAEASQAGARGKGSSRTPK